MPKRSAVQLVEDSDRASSDMQLTKAKADTANWRHRCNEAVAHALSLESQAELLVGLQGEPAIRKFERAKKGKPRGVAVVVPASDWHVEEHVDSAATGGVNSFDLAEAERRIRRFYGKVLELLDWQSHLAPVTEIWHPLLGDLLSGYIHEELVETNSLSPTEACVFLQEMICSGIDLWLRNTKLPIYVPTCVGNHGRTTVKKRIKTSCRNSFEWLLYKTLAKHYANHRRVAWHVGCGYHNTQTIVDRKIRFHHGDALRYQGGIGGISIPVNKAIAQWDKVQAVDFDVFGHWHQFQFFYPKWIACGSLMGFSEFSLAIKADFQHPSQTFIVIDRRYGVTSALPIFLTESKRR